MLLIMLAGAGIAGAIASGKNQNVALFALFGALFPLIGILVAAVMPKRELEGSL
ncbi:MAG: hypothetical protein QM831_39685 [Kofleriaceae bacterium]